MDRNYLIQLGVSDETAEKILAAFTAALSQQEQQFKEQLTQAQMMSALESVLMEAGAYDAKAVIPFLRLDSVTYQNQEFSGLREQLEQLRHTKSFLFRQEDKSAIPSAGSSCRTGLSHSGLSAVSPSAMTDAQYYAAFRK